MVMRMAGTNSGKWYGSTCPAGTMNFIDWALNWDAMLMTTEGMVVVVVDALDEAIVAGSDDIQMDVAGDDEEIVAKSADGPQ